MLDLFTAERSHFYQSATLLDVGPIPQADMARFFKEQFARGKRELSADTLQAIFALDGESPNDQQQLAYHLWTQSTPGRLGQEELMRPWVLLQVVNIPSLFPASRPFIASSEQGLLLPYLSNTLK